MVLMVWLRGVLMGIAIAAPVGPIGVLCIRRTLAYGWRIGFVSGGGAATADGFYGMVAAFGLTAITGRLVAHAEGLSLVGGLFLCWLGLRTFLARVNAVELSVNATDSPESLSNEPRHKDLDKQMRSHTSLTRLLSAYSSTLFLTLTNPLTIVSFLGIFAGLGLAKGNSVESVALVVGVFIGSLLWWLVLVSGVTYLRNRLTPTRLAQFNRITSRFFGVVILGFGLAALFLG